MIADMDRVTGVACEGGGWIDTIVVNCNDINRKRDTWRGNSAALTARNWRKSWKIPQVIQRQNRRTTTATQKYRIRKNTTQHMTTAFINNIC